jgi:pimeloyl-ACP methyl ester carboxylesterase
MDAILIWTLRRFQQQGAILFVSHDTSAVLNLCERASFDHERAQGCGGVWPPRAECFLNRLRAEPAMLKGWMDRLLMPGVVDFVTQSSPTTHAAQLKCPTFLFHAQDDSNCPIADTNAFAEQLKRQGTDVKYVTVPSGEHYDSMINEGIPAGIEWLKERGAIAGR